MAIELSRIPSLSSARLTYDASTEVLRGVIGQNPPFFIRAYSGGSRGHKARVSQPLAEKYLHWQASSFRSRLATTPQRLDAHKAYIERGGTLPQGHYRCHYKHHHAHFGECIYLDRQFDARVIRSPFALSPFSHGRKNDFFIHGGGPKGSDGCIVPQSETERRRLNRAVRDYKGSVTLEVINVPYELPAERFDGRLS